jgi:hypothetical protein
MSVLRPASFLLGFFAAACSSATSSSSVSDVPGPSADASVVTDAGATPDAPATPAVKLTGFTAKGAVFQAARSLKDDGLLDIIIGDAGEVCHTPRTEQFTKSLHLTLHAKGPMAPGTFPVVDDTIMGGSGPPPQATAIVWDLYDVAGIYLCSVSNSDYGVTGGSITITKVSDTVVEGTLSMTLQKGGAVSGAFKANACAHPDARGHACALVH